VPLQGQPPKRFPPRSSGLHSESVWGKNSPPAIADVWHIVMTVDGAVNMPPLPVVGLATRNLRGPPKVNVGAINENDPDLISEDSGGPDKSKKLRLGNSLEPFRENSFAIFCTSKDIRTPCERIKVGIRVGKTPKESSAQSFSEQANESQFPQSMRCILPTWRLFGSASRRSDQSYYGPLLTNTLNRSGNWLPW